VSGAEQCAAASAPQTA